MNYKSIYNGLTIVHPLSGKVQLIDVRECLINYFGSEEDIPNEGTIILTIRQHIVTVFKFQD